MKMGVKWGGGGVGFPLLRGGGGGGGGWCQGGCEHKQRIEAIVKMEKKCKKFGGGGQDWVDVTEELI